MMQMDLDFTPSISAVLSETINQSVVMLLGRIEVRVPKGVAIRIAPGCHRLRVLLTPCFYTSQLLEVVDESRGTIRIDSRLEVIGHCKHEVQRPPRPNGRPRKRFPDRHGQPAAMGPHTQH